MRNREKHRSLTFQIQEMLQEKLAIGRSKYHDKINGETSDKIYSWNTFRSYMKHANYFAEYCKIEHGCKTISECRQYVNEYLESRSKLSAYTQKLEACSLAKLYNCKSTDFIKTSVRKRGDITRSRGEKIRDKFFSEEKNKDFVDFCRSTGLRRSELSMLTGDKFIYRDEKPYIIVEKGKGGKYREAPVINNIELVKKIMKAAGQEKVFKKLPGGADIHNYRSMYATSIYKAYARPFDQIPYDSKDKAGKPFKSQIYRFRGDRKGVEMDRLAMLEVSRALGHNRVSVVADHYIRD